MTPEGKVKEKVKKLLISRGVYYIMPMGQAFGRAGVPDFVCCLHGRFFSIETKANGRRPTNLQEYEMHKIRAAGGVAFVINESNLDMLDKMLERWLNESNQ